MKKITLNVLLLFSVLATPIVSTAQDGSLLKAVKDKITSGKSKEGDSAKGDTSKGGSAMEKDLIKDSTSKVLESRPIRTDSRSLSGIYYSKFPMRVNKGSGFGYVKKFLVELNEGNTMLLRFQTRLSVELNLDPLSFTNRPNTPDYFPITTSKKLGHYLIDDVVNMYGKPASDNHTQEINKLDFSKPAGEEVVFSGWGLDYRYVLELEPGILIIANLDNIIDAKTPEQYKVLQEKGSYNLFYKAELKDKALAMTDAQIWDKCKAFFVKYMDAYNKADDERSALPKPVAAFKEQPSNESLMKAVKARMEEMPYYRDRELVYVYTVAPWEKMYEYIGRQGKTLTYRQMQVIAVFKHGNKCQYARMLMRQDNAYEGGTAIERFSGNEVFCNGDQQLEDVKCEKAMIHKK